MLKINDEEFNVLKAGLYEGTEIFTDEYPNGDIKRGMTKFLTLIVEFKSKEKIDDKYIEGRFYFDIKKISKESFSTIIGKNIYLDIDQDDDNEQLDDFGLSTNISNYYSGWNHDYFPGNVTLIFKEKKDKSVLIELHIDDNERNKTLIDYKDYVKISD